MADVEYLTVSRLTIKEVTRLFNKIAIDLESGCWNWLGAKDEDGYGFFAVNHHQTRVHRIVHAWAIGPVPKGVAARKFAQVDHLCRNKSCCNPVHLELVTQRVNVARGSSPIADSMKRTNCIYGHPLTAVKNNPRRRECKTCDSLRHKARRSGPNAEKCREIGRRAAKKHYDKKRGEKLIV